MKRDRSIDYEKGFVVACMVLCHILQFFGNPAEYPAEENIMRAINALAFSTFVFAYGRSIAASWLELPWKRSLPRALRSALRSYAAFILSGTAYKVLCEGKDFSRWAPLNVVLLRSIPGWSEFLIALALIGLLAALTLPALRWLSDRPLPLLLVCALCLAATQMPYGQIKDFRIGLLIGTTRFACFPVVQYLPFLLAGIYAGRHGFNRWMALGALLLTSIAVYVWVQYGEPSRFPPSLPWLMTPCLGIALLDLISRKLAAWTDARRPIQTLLRPLSYLGMNSLYYLITSNLCIFALSNTGTLPIYRAKEWFPFNLPTGSVAWAIAWTAVMLIVIGFVGTLVRREKKDNH